MDVRVPTPPLLRGNAEQQAAQINSYLFKVAEILNMVLSELPDPTIKKE